MKLGIRKGNKIHVKNAPCDNYLKLFDEFPEGVEIENRSELDVFHLFTKSSKELREGSKKKYFQNKTYGNDLGILALKELKNKYKCNRGFYQERYSAAQFG